MTSRYKVIIETVTRTTVVYLRARTKREAMNKALLESKIGDYLKIQVLDN